MQSLIHLEMQHIQHYLLTAWGRCADHRSRTDRIMAAAIVKFAGARHVVVTDMNQYRLELAAKMGATRSVNLTQEKNLKDVMNEIGMTEGFDVGLECPEVRRDLLI